MVEADKEQNSNEDKNNQSKTKKHVSFTKPVYTIIDVKSYKKLKIIFSNLFDLGLGIGNWGLAIGIGIGPNLQN